MGFPEEKSTYNHQTSEAWDSRDTKFLYLYHKYVHAKGSEKTKYRKLYLEELSLRQQIDLYIKSFAKDSKLFSTKVKGNNNRDCYEAGIAQMEAIFGRNDDNFK